MPQSLSQIYLHIVFSTKHRTAFLANPVIRQQLHAYITGIAKVKDSPCIQVGGVADHVHIFLKLARTIAVADLVKEIKRVSTKWLRETWPELNAFQWQSGYSVFSISTTHADGLSQYVRKQEEHHSRESFQDELRRLLKKNEIDYDEQYLWD